jgi:two-component system, LytTR family, sensor kinase
MKDRKTIVPFLGIWFFIILLHFSTLYYANGFSIAFCIADSIISGITFMIIALVLWYPIRFGINSLRSIADTILNNLIVYALSASVWIFVTWGFIILLNPEWNEPFKSTIVSYRLLASLLFYISSVVVYYAIGFYESLQEKQAHEMQLKTLVKEAQLNELRSQLHPHFLFNSLNSINSLTISNPAKAGEMIIKLSDFLRYSLSRKGHSMADFEKELHHIQLYLDIEKVRFGERLEFIYETEDVPQNWPVPLMLLQPLVENAVKHGVYNTGEKVQIKLFAKTEENILVISISNNFDSDTTNNNGTGTGLSNVRERMKLVYGQDGLFKTRIEGNEFIAVLRIPKL